MREPPSDTRYRNRTGTLVHLYNARWATELALPSNLTLQHHDIRTCCILNTFISGSGSPWERASTFRSREEKKGATGLVNTKRHDAISSLRPCFISSLPLVWGVKKHYCRLLLSLLRKKGDFSSPFFSFLAHFILLSITETSVLPLSGYLETLLCAYVHASYEIILLQCSSLTSRILLFPPQFGVFTINQSADSALSGKFDKRMTPGPS